VQRWEIKSHWVPVDLARTVVPTESEHFHTVDLDPQWKDKFKKAWAEAEVLANDGWELVSVAPETCARVTAGDRSGMAVGVACSYTAGYLLAFRRPKP
jgi:hypothetical protein